MPSILIVEDDCDIQATVALALQAFGYQTETAADGSRALDCLRTEQAPDLILLDMRMPVMNGREFLEASRSDAFPRMPILWMTAEAFLTEDAFVDDRIVGIVRKPFSFLELKDAVEQALSATLSLEPPNC